MTFSVGQKVWCVLFGPGTVTEVNNRPIAQYNDIAVRFVRNNLVATFTPDGRSHVKSDVCLFPYPVKVVRDDEPKRPSINWEHVGEKFKWLATNMDGDPWLYEYKPTSGVGDFWLPSKGESFKVSGLASYVPGTCDWKDSLVKRPETDSEGETP